MLCASFRSTIILGESPDKSRTLLLSSSAYASHLPFGSTTTSWTAYLYFPRGIVQLLEVLPFRRPRYAILPPEQVTMSFFQVASNCITPSAPNSDLNYKTFLFV